jgi:hypothetical protein
MNSPTHGIAPVLTGWEGSWIVTDKTTGKVIAEIFDRSCVESLNPDRFLIESIGTYLGRINKSFTAGAK